MNIDSFCPKCGSDNVSIRYHDRVRTEALIMALKGATVLPLPCLFEPPRHLHHYCLRCGHQWAQRPVDDELEDGKVPAGANFAVARGDEPPQREWLRNLTVSGVLAAALLLLVWARGS